MEENKMKKILSGKIVAEIKKNDLKIALEKLPRKLNLIIIHHNDPASLSYLKGRQKLADFLNINLIEKIIEEDTSEENILNWIENYNNDDQIDEIIVDRTLQKKYNEEKIISKIDFNKDVDGFNFYNLGRLISNYKSFKSCTPAAAIELIKYYKYDLNGKNALVIGRSVNVGKPLALMLLNENATVTIAHSKTQNLKKLTKKADIIFLAIGKAKFLTKDMVKRNTIVIDIGINFDENNKLCGDADKQIYDYIRSYSPVPGGVGVLTNIMLMENLLLSYKMRHQNG